MLLAPMQQDFGVLEIVAHDKPPVPLGGGGTGPLMEYGLDVAEFVTSKDATDEDVTFQVIPNIEISQIDHLVAIDEMIDNQNVVATPSVKTRDDIAADKSGTASDDDHGPRPVSLGEG